MIERLAVGEVHEVHDAEQHRQPTASRGTCCPHRGRRSGSGRTGHDTLPMSSRRGGPACQVRRRGPRRRSHRCAARGRDRRCRAHVVPTARPPGSCDPAHGAVRAARTRRRRRRPPRRGSSRSSGLDHASRTATRVVRPGPPRGRQLRCPTCLAGQGTTHHLRPSAPCGPPGHSGAGDGGLLDREVLEDAAALRHPGRPRGDERRPGRNPVMSFPSSGSDRMPV